jgi:two-component system sensor kinase FixL
MQSKAEPVMPINTASVWAEEPPSPKTARQAPVQRLLVAAAATILILAILGDVWIYFSGANALKTAATQLAANAHATLPAATLVTAVHNWGLTQALGGVAGGAGIFLALLYLSRTLQEQWAGRFVSSAKAADERAQLLLGQLADARVSLEESQREQTELQTRLNSLAQRLATQEKELDRQRLAEKSMAQQTQMLERSKDVLELHVQARASEMQKLQRRNELILNSAGDGICGFDLQGHATFVNPAVTRLCGWTVEELLGKTEDEIFFPLKPKSAKHSQGWLKDDDGNYLPEQLLSRKDGTLFHAEYARTPIQENDKTVGTVVIFRDITERRLAEDKLNHKAAELARSNRELEQFAFVASHDLQEPLRKIQAFGDRLKAKCESANLEEGRDYLERMQSAAARMQTLINDLLTFSRVISSSQPFLPVNLEAVTREVLVDLEHRIEKTQARVNLAKLPTVEADPTQMRQLMQNLIGNALKFQKPGNKPVVTLEASVVKRHEIQKDAILPKPAPTSGPDDQFCVLTVQDNGIGFDEQYLDKVFAVFQRLHGRSEYEGTGVGLAVCRRITERHAGTITAKSKPGEGACFIVILPIKQQPAPTPA